MRTLLIGGTDLTVAVAAEMLRGDFAPCAVVGIGSQFTISYAKAPVANVRKGDIRGWCGEHNVPYVETTDSKAIGRFAAEHRAEFGLVAGWYHLIPKWLRDQFSYGVAGVHASLLPKLRGGAPLNWAILTGLEETGVTLFELGDGVDDGPIYLQARLALGSRTNVGELVAKAEALALDLIRQAIPRIASRSLDPRPQQGTPTYCLQRVPSDGKIDWRQDAVDVDRLVRAVSRPYPGAFTDLNGQEIRIWSGTNSAEPEVFGAPGQIARLTEYGRPCVVTGGGLFVVEEATLEDGSDAVPLLMSSGNQRLHSI